MFAIRRSLYVLGAALFAAAPPSALRVLRTTPIGDADVAAEITITFDRPVAGSLDRSVDARTIVSITPASPVSVTWRDPVTIAITPRRPWQPATTYRVQVRDSFRAMDGAKLDAPYAFTVHVHGPLLVTGNPVNTAVQPRWLTPAARFELVYSSPPTLATFRSAYVELGTTCSGPRTMRLTAASMRRVTADDPWPYRAGAPDSLRRVVTLVPEAPLPLNCDAVLVAPQEITEASPVVRMPFHTYGPFRATGLKCAESGTFCPAGPAQLAFSTPVRAAEVLRHVRLLPDTKFTVRDTSEESDVITLEAELKPRLAYAVVLDTTLRDVFGQRLAGNPALALQTTGYAPNITYPFGRLTVERSGYGTLAVQHVNVDTLLVTVAPIPDSLEGAFLRRSQWSLGELWEQVKDRATVTRIPLHASPDVSAVTGVKLPVGSGTATLYAVKVTRPGASGNETWPTVAVVQVTDLGVHAKIGAESGVVWVTDASDGKARAGTHVTLYDFRGKAVATATTNADGIASLSGFHGEPMAGQHVSDDEEGDEDEGSGGAYQIFEGYVGVTLGSDRALVGVSQYDPDLSAWRFNIAPAWGSTSIPMAGAVFTERGIYRPGDPLYVKAIVRAGPLGALRVPDRGDSLKWTFHDRDNGAFKDTTVALSAFGTSDVMVTVPANAAIGWYAVQAQVRHYGQWLDVGSATYRVAEYRPPEFLVDVAGDKQPRFTGDSAHAVVQARYLFGAPMSRAAMTWQAWITPAPSWSFAIPNTDGWFIGQTGWWWEDEWWPGRGEQGPEVFASGTDTLDANGAQSIALAIPALGKGRAGTLTISTAVQDVNRQTVGARMSIPVHPASFYLGGKPTGSSFFWTEGKPTTLQVIAVRPTGERVSGVKVRGVIARREWHQVHRERDGVAETVGEWVTDTVGRCDVSTAADPVTCSVTPIGGGTYTVTLNARDERGREVTTSFYRWATGKDWVPWDDESRLKVDVIADRTKYTVGDTATILFASPFTDAEAWITVEREGLIEQRRMTLTSGSTTLKLPITEAFVPNAFVSIFIARGRSAKPGRLDDPGRPTIRVGYAELRVTPEIKRLTVTLEPVGTQTAMAPHGPTGPTAEYRPGDTAQVRITVTDAAGAPRRAEVTLWAADEGVLALTGYTTPNPIDLLYAPRGLGLRLASNMATVAPQIPEGEKGGRAPGGGGGADRADILRTQFKTTAFFLGSVVTDAQGRATARAKLPDNLTTFRVMAVAVTAGDRFGSAQSAILVSRPLLARAALPRFVRPGDNFTAGAVINQRSGAAGSVTVDASATGITLTGARTQRATLAVGRGVEVRFPFRASDGDTATFHFGVTNARDADAVQTRVRVRPDYVPRAITVAGVIRDSATSDIVLPADIDPARSRIAFSLGASPLSLLRGIYADYHVYPYYCSEQVTSVAMPLLAIYRATDIGADTATAQRQRVRRELERAVAILLSRQRTDGGIGLWNATDWTSAWLSVHVGTFLTEAKSSGIVVSDSALAALAQYVQRELHRPRTDARTIPVAVYYEHSEAWLAEQVAAVDYLSMAGQPDIAMENQLYATAARLAWEDRARLAEVMGRRGATREALTLLAPAWGQLRLDGTRAVLPQHIHANFYFESGTRPIARLLRATILVSPTSPLIGSMMETMIASVRSDPWGWNTQDVFNVALALAAYGREQSAAARGGITVRSGDRAIFRTAAGAASTDSMLPLTGLATARPDGSQAVHLSLSGPAATPAYYYITIYEVPRHRPVRPSDDGIRVDRWYERYDTGKPVTRVAEGDLVRVRLRVTVPTDRHFVVLDDALPAGLEAVDLSLRTSTLQAGPGAGARRADDQDQEAEGTSTYWAYGSWESGWWTPWDHKELRDDRVVFVATQLWPGVYTATYVARATTPGVFVRPPAHAEEMYNPAVNGRSDGGVFTVTKK